MLQGVRATLKLKLLEHKLINPTICNLYFTKKPKLKESPCMKRSSVFMILLFERK